jgi:glycosyltransferase involved in cell wall biosynthesis
VTDPKVRAVPGEPSADLSVILCAHNEEEVIAQQLQALTAQRCDERWELIVVCHRSTDATSQIAESYQTRLPHMTVIRLATGTTLAHARNAGVRRAQGSKLVMCDADDKVQPGWLMAMSTALDAHAIVGARLDPTTVNPSWLIRAREIGQIRSLPTYLGKPWSYGAGLGFRRLVFDAVGGFDERLYSGEDCDFGVRAAAVGFRTEFVADAAVCYRFRADAASAFRQGRANGEAEALLMVRYGARSDRRIFWGHNVVELLRLAPRLASVPLRPNVVDRRIHKVAYARRAGRMIGRFRGAVRYGCVPW